MLITEWKNKVIYIFSSNFIASENFNCDSFHNIKKRLLGLIILIYQNYTLWWTGYFKFNIEMKGMILVGTVKFTIFYMLNRFLISEPTMMAATELQPGNEGGRKGEEETSQGEGGTYKEKLGWEEEENDGPTNETDLMHLLDVGSDEEEQECNTTPQGGQDKTPDSGGEEGEMAVDHNYEDDSMEQEIRVEKATTKDKGRKTEEEVETGKLAKLLSNLSDKVMRGNEGGKKVAKRIWKLLGKGKTERGKMEKEKMDGGEKGKTQPKGKELGAGSRPLGTSTAGEEQAVPGPSGLQGVVNKPLQAGEDGKSGLARSTSTTSLVPLSEGSFRKRKVSQTPGRDRKRLKPNPLTLEHKLVEGFKEKRAPFMSGEQRVVEQSTQTVHLTKVNIPNTVTGFEQDTRMFLIRNSNNARGEGVTNNTGTYWHGECDVCKDKHKTDKSPRVLFLGDQSVPALIGGGGSCCLVERLENATLAQIGDLVENLVKDGSRARHLKLAPGSLIAIFSLSELLRLGTWAYFRELDILKGRIQRLLMDAGMQWKNLPTVAASIFPCCSDSPHAEEIYSDYYNALVAHRNLDTNQAKVVLVDLEPLSDYLSWTKGDRLCLTSCDRVSFSPNMCLVTVRSQYHVRKLDYTQWGERGVSAELEYKWLDLLIKDISMSTDLVANMARLQLPNEEDLRWGVAQHYNPLLTNMVRPDTRPAWVDRILEAEYPDLLEGEELTDPGKIVLIGTSNARRIHIEMEKKGYNVCYISAMRADMETAETALENVAKLELGGQDRIVIAMFGNSFIRTKAGSGKHLDNPRELQDFEVDNLTGSVSWLATELEKRFPLCGMVIYGPLPRYTPSCCVKHPNTGEFVLREIKKVDRAMEGVVRSKGLKNTMFVSALDALDQGEFGNPSHLAPNDPIHLSDLGKRLMMRHILNVIGTGVPVDQGTSG